MHLIEITPAPCIVCGRGNVQRETGDPVSFVDLERDINWNDPAIICEDCVARAAGLVGMMSKDTMHTLTRQIKDRDDEIHQLRATVDSMKRRAARMGIEFTAPEKDVA